MWRGRAGGERRGAPEFLETEEERQASHPGGAWRGALGGGALIHLHRSAVAEPQYSAALASGPFVNSHTRGSELRAGVGAGGRTPGKTGGGWTFQSARRKSVLRVSRKAAGLPRFSPGDGRQPSSAG